MSAPLSSEAMAAIQAAAALGLSSLRADVPQTLSEWAAEHFLLAGESSHQKGGWVGWPFQLGILDFMSDDRIEELAVKKSKRVGYALALDTPIPTLDGWKRMGDLQEGDQLFDEKGQPCTVQYLSPIYTDHDCYRIRFSDGTSVVADAGHRWPVESRYSFEYLLGQRGKGRVGRPQASEEVTHSGVLSTQQIAQILAQPRRYNVLRVPCAQPIECPEQTLPIPPYTLGLWLGDGHLVTPRITQHISDTETADFIRQEGIQVTVRCLDARYPDNATLLLDVPDGSRISPWAAPFRALGLMQRKHIPQQYLRASVGQRLALLRGLMDSDGTVGDDGRAEFTNTNQDLALGVHELLSSLGIKSTFRTRPPQRPGCLMQYRINFKPMPQLNPFLLKRKAVMVQPAARPTITHTRTIVSVQPVDSVPVRCIQVSSPSSLFLCTRAMVPTHNTKMITAFVAYNIAHRRRKQALWQPTDDDRDSYVKSEIEPVLDGVAAVQAARRQGKGVEDTIKYKPFRDSVLHLLGGKAARAYRRITVAVSILDEWSAFDQSIEKSGDPGSLAKGRLEGAPYPKFVGGSTPRIKGICHVERACEESDAYVQYHIECPRCGAEHPLVWGSKELPYGFKWVKGQPASVHHVCPHCLQSITQADYLPGGWPLTGTWVCKKTGRRYGADRIWRDAAGQPCRPPCTLGVHVWAAYSPQRTWVSIVDEFEKAHRALQAGDVGPMTGFTNETLGETWELKGDSSDEHALQARAEDYPLGRVPAGALLLTAGVDVQRDRWEIAIWAWGRGLESWAITHHIIQGNPASEADWEPVTQYLQQRYVQAWHGGSLGLSAISIDSSDQTQAVYNWVRSAQGQLAGLRAIKGDNNDNRNIVGPSSLQEVNYRGRKISHGIKLWLVGVDSAKDLLLGQLAIDKPGPGYVHTGQKLPREWYEQLTAEQRVLVKVNGKDVYRWVKRRPRNEVLDCRNYALHAAMCLGVHKWPEARWLQLEQTVQPPQDLFNTAQAPAAQPEKQGDEAVPPRAPARPSPSRQLADEELFSPISLY